MDIIKALSTVDDFLSNGENKLAIDMLLQRLNFDSNSSVILSTLGRAYRIDNQPEKAVVYLKKSLEVMRANKAKNDNLVAYQSDKFCDDDMGFIESEANDFLEEEYALEVNELTQATTYNENQENINYRSSLHAYTVETRVLRSIDDIKRIKIVCRDKGACTLDNSGVPFLEYGSWDRLLEDVLRSISSLAGGDISHTSAKSIDNSSVVKQESQLTIPIENALVTNSLLSVREETTEQSLIDKNKFSGQESDGELKLFENDRLFWGESFEGNVDDQDSEALDDFVSTSSITLEEELDEQLEEQIWDDFEGLDEFDEYASRKIEEQIQEDEKVSREDRARQVAVEVLGKSDWDIKHLSLLENIFIENGWSAAKAAIEREIGKSLLPEELFLARKIRRFWAGNEQYWMTFHKIRYNSLSQQTDTFYKSMSWPESLKIIRCFPSFPDIEEIYTFIDEIFDHWYSSNKLRRIFPAFFQFLKYRVESMSKPLQGETLFSFLYYENDSFDVDSNRLNNSISPECQELSRLDFQINQWGPPENRIKIIWETSE